MTENLEKCLISALIQHIIQQFFCICLFHENQVVFVKDFDIFFLAIQNSSLLYYIYSYTAVKVPSSPVQSHASIP